MITPIRLGITVARRLPICLNMATGYPFTSAR